LIEQLQGAEAQISSLAAAGRHSLDSNPGGREARRMPRESMPWVLRSKAVVSRRATARDRSQYARTEARFIEPDGPPPGKREERGQVPCGERRTQQSAQS
jgi:hypothetical protein